MSAGHGLTRSPAALMVGQYRIAWEADAVPERKLFQCKRLLHSQDYSLVIVTVCMPCHGEARKHLFIVPINGRLCGPACLHGSALSC